jgi:prevent-host-death family protein
MASITIHKAKTQLSKLIARAEAGEEIEIARGKEVVAKIVPARPTKRKNLGYGAWKGQAKVLGDLLEPLPPEELSLWEDGPIEPPA